MEFLELLRENSVADGTAVAKFLETSQGNDALAATECAAHALHVAQKMAPRQGHGRGVGPGVGPEMLGAMWRYVGK